MPRLVRKYASYEEYVRHQGSKLDRFLGPILAAEQPWREALVARLKQDKLDLVGRLVLCLAARFGAEVLAFRDLGGVSFGVDLRPGGCVLPGDFHVLPFRSGCAELVFTNSFDHSLMPERLISEIGRVLSPEGILIVEISRGTAEGYLFDDWDILRWESAAEALAMIEARGFTRLSESEFTYPWPGVHAVLRK